MKLGVLLNGLSELKILQPIIEHLFKLNIPYVLFIRSEESNKRSYNIITKESINISSKIILSGANKVIWFSGDEIAQKVNSSQIDKMLIIEAPRHRDLLTKCSCKVYSISYFSDSCFKRKVWLNNIERIYHTTKHSMNMWHKFHSIPYDQKRDRLLGSPMFDCLDPNPKSKGLILFAPNIYEENLPATFQTPTKMARIIRRIMNKHPLSIIKSRQKQYLPRKTKNEFRSRIYYDGGVMYPSLSSGLFRNSNISFMFYSSTIYEAVLSGQYIMNCHINFGRWKYHEKVRQYMTPLYKNIDGLIETITTDDIMTDNFSYDNKRADPQKRQQWIKKFINDENISDSYKKITNDLLSGPVWY